MARARRPAQRKETGVKGARILVVEARYYEDIADLLLRGAKRVLRDALFGLRRDQTCRAKCRDSNGQGGQKTANENRKAPFHDQGPSVRATRKPLKV